MENTPAMGEVRIVCPACDEPLSVTVLANDVHQLNNGMVEVDIVTDKRDLHLHALICGS